MNTKKYKHADLEKKRVIFFQIGLIIALGSALAAFEWGSNSAKIEQHVTVDPWGDVEDIIIPITKHENKKQELPKAPLVLLEEFKLVEDSYEGPDDEPVLPSEEPEIWKDVDLQPEADDSPITFFKVEHMPEFPGGENALLKYLASNIHYPEVCMDLGIDGKVYVSFIVNENGSVVEAKIVRSPDGNLSKEALRVINNMPIWKPGKQRDKAVRVAYTVPVNFVLQ